MLWHFETASTLRQTKRHLGVASTETYQPLRDTQVQKIEGDTSGQPCASFGLHEQLTFVKSLYDDEDLLFLANTGVLD